MGLTIETSVSALVVFIQGLLSFFSPCVLPLVPLYIGYLAGGASELQKDGHIVFPRKKVMMNTLFFILGVSFAFFALGFGFTTIGQFFGGNRKIFAQVGGILVIFFGLYQLGVFGSGILSKEHRLSMKLNTISMNPLTALLLGFTFSFAWTPCVGPALTSVLLMTSSAQNSSYGFLLIGIYTLGFVLPFFAVGLTAGKLLSLFKRHVNIVRYTVKVGGVLMIFMGFMMFSGLMNNVTGYLSKLGTSSSPSRESDILQTEASSEEVSAAEPKAASETERNAVPAHDFTLKDQYGETHTLSEYKGKAVLLNFWATWCGYCKQEMPDLQALYEEYGENKEDVIILGIAAPDTNDVSEKEITDFLESEGITYPTVMNPEGDLFGVYGATALPTTFMIDADGNAYGYVAGALSKGQLKNIIAQTIESTKSGQ